MAEALCLPAFSQGQVLGKRERLRVSLRARSSAERDGHSSSERAHRTLHGCLLLWLYFVLGNLSCDDMSSILSLWIVCVGGLLCRFFSSLTFHVLLAVLSCCFTVSLDINYVVFSLSLFSSSPTVTITAV